MEKKEITAGKVVSTSFIVDVLDVLLNLIVAIFSGSVIMLTEVLEGASDLAASGILLFGLARASKKADRDHPFGYGREIYFWTLLSALVTLGITASLSIYFGWERIIHPKPIHGIQFVLGILIITIFTNGYAFFLSYKRLLRRRPPKFIVKIFYKSSLVETKTTFVLDLMGTVAAILGVIALLIYAMTGDSRFDGAGAIVIGVAIAISAFFLLEGVRDLLVGRSAAPDVEEKIKKAAMNVDEVSKVLGIKTLHVGSEKLLVDLDVHMEANLTTRELERLIDKIKKEIRAEVPSVKYLQVELETPRE